MPGWLKTITTSLSEYKWVASGGNHLNNIGRPVPRKHSKTKEWLSQCKFVIYADDFDSENDLVEYVKTVDNDDELYCTIWNQHLITNPEMNYAVIRDKLRKKLFDLIDTKKNNIS